MWIICLQISQNTANLNVYIFKKNNKLSIIHSRVFFCYNLYINCKRDPDWIFNLKKEEKAYGEF